MFTDITYLTFGKRILYLSTIMDAFSIEIINLSIGESTNLLLTIEAVKYAIRKITYNRARIQKKKKRLLLS